MATTHTNIRPVEGLIHIYDKDNITWDQYDPTGGDDPYLFLLNKKKSTMECYYNIYLGYNEKIRCFFLNNDWDGERKLLFPTDMMDCGKLIATVKEYISHVHKVATQ